MESSSLPESLPGSRIKAIQELTRGRVLTDKLREMLGRPKDIEYDIKSDNDVVVQILEMFDNTLSILSSSNLNGIVHDLIDDGSNPRSEVYHKSQDSGEKISSVTSVKSRRGCYKRKKNASTITKVISTLIDDGYVWRKYGQKKILNSKYQRNYFRCSHKNEQGCEATKQVQKIDDKPSKYMITYNGFHTCNKSQIAPQIILEASNPKDNSILISFDTNTLMEKNKVGTCFPSMENTPKECFPSLYPFNHEQVSTFDHHVPWDPVMGLSQVSFEPMSTMSYALDCENITSSAVFSPACTTHGYEINDMIESHDFDDFLFQLW